MQVLLVVQNASMVEVGSFPCTVNIERSWLGLWQRQWLFRVWGFWESLADLDGPYLYVLFQSRSWGLFFEPVTTSEPLDPVLPKEPVALALQGLRACTCTCVGSYRMPQWPGSEKWLLADMLSCEILWGHLQVIRQVQWKFWSLWVLRPLNFTHYEWKVTVIGHWTAWPCIGSENRRNQNSSISSRLSWNDECHGCFLHMVGDYAVFDKWSSRRWRSIDYCWEIQVSFESDCHCYQIGQTCTNDQFKPIYVFNGSSTEYYMALSRIVQSMVARRESYLQDWPECDISVLQSPARYGLDTTSPGFFGLA